MNEEELITKILAKAGNGGYDVQEEYACIEQIIFDHAFAQAFWGHLPMCRACERHHSFSADCDCGIGNDSQEWQVRLRQMVLEDHPLQYLAQFVKEGVVV